MLLMLRDDPAKAQQWLAELLPYVAFGDGRRLRRDAVITAALGPGALTKLRLSEECVKGFPAAYLDEMASPARARILGDVGDNSSDRWLWGKSCPDVALLVYGRSAAAVTELETQIKLLATLHGQDFLHQIDLKEIVRDKSEPFGFVDGISQPTIRGTYKGLRQSDPIHLVEPGEFVLGYPDNRGNTPPGPVLSPLLDPHNRLPVAAASSDFAINTVCESRDIGRNASFLVIRQLEQDVAAFDRYCADEAKRLKERVGPPHRVDANFVAAKLIGRWKDGSSLVRHPYMPLSEEIDIRTQSNVMSRPKSGPDDKTPVEPPAKPSFRQDNDFLFGEEDPEALRCPFGAHIRRANPRDSFDPGSADQIAISNRHRLLRVGRFYQPDEGKNPGLLFMCLNADLERQFEFIQQTWLASPSFHGLVGEQDPVIGNAQSYATGFMIPTRDGPVRLKPLPRFVTMRGGGYFFLPGKRLLSFLAGDR
jgi:deferrochelatase/peroxidase EfeB